MRPIADDVKRPCWHIRFSNPSEEMISRCEYMMCDSCVVGLEVGSKTERPHIQSVWYWANQKTKSQLKKMFKPEEGKSYYIEPMIRPWDKNAAYCSKESEIRRQGEGPTNQGQRTDLLALKDHIDEGGTWEECYNVHFPSMIRYERGLQNYYDLKRQHVHRTEMTKGIWLWGKTGTGKSHRIYKNYDIRTHYIKSVSKKEVDWWDNYAGQRIVVINEFRGQIEYAELLDILDKWPKVVSRRGRQPCQFISQKVLISSCKPPERVYCQQVHQEDSIDQLMRRLEVVHIKDKSDHPLLDLSCH